MQHARLIHTGNQALCKHDSYFTVIFSDHCLVIAKTSNINTRVLPGSCQGPPRFRFPEFINSLTLHRISTTPSTTMLFAHPIFFVCACVALTRGAAVPEAKKNCHTIDSGFLSTFVGVNSLLFTLTITGCALISLLKPLMAITKHWTSIAKRNSHSKAGKRSKPHSR